MKAKLGLWFPILIIAVFTLYFFPEWIIEPTENIGYEDTEGLHPLHIALGVFAVFLFIAFGAENRKLRRANRRNEEAWKRRVGKKTYRRVTRRHK